MPLWLLSKKVTMFRLIFLIALLFVPTFAWAQQNTPAKQAYVIDYETGQVLLDKSSTQQMPTSSMSKVMTVYMVFDALKIGRIDLDSEFRVSEKAWAKGGSKMFVAQGSKVSIEDLLHGVIIQSGNDATIVLAEGLEGSEDAFAQKMTRKALEIGMEDSNFTNASGWPDKDHYSTARDLALMARRMIEDYPEHYKFFSKKEFTYSNIKQANRNPLLYAGIGADGLKTGHTEAGGYGLIGTAVKDGRRVLMVINGLPSEKSRKEESTRLIEWGLNDFENKTVLKKATIIANAPVAMGQTKEVGLVIKKDVKITIPKAPKNNYKIEINYKTPLVAPLNAGDEVGTARIIIPNMPPIEHTLYVAEDVYKLGFFKATFEKAKRFIVGQL